MTIGKAAVESILAEDYLVHFTDEAVAELGSMAAVEMS